MATTIGKLAFLIGANASGFTSAMKGVHGQVARLGKGGLAGGMMSLGRAATRTLLPLTGIGAAIGGMAAGAAVFRRGLNFEEVSRSFGSLSDSIDTTGESFLGKLREGTRGAVNDYDLMLAANNAMLLGVARSDDQFASLASKAMRLGQAMGRGPVESLNDIVVGIGRQSKLILDNLGLQVSATKAYDDYAAAIGKSAHALTDAEKKQAFFNATMAAVDEKMLILPQTVDSAKISFQKLGASILNLLDRAVTPLVQALAPLADKLAVELTAALSSVDWEAFRAGVQSTTDAIAALIKNVSAAAASLTPGGLGLGPLLSAFQVVAHKGAGEKMAAERGWLHGPLATDEEFAPLKKIGEELSKPVLSLADPAASFKKALEETGNALVKEEEKTNARMQAVRG